MKRTFAVITLGAVLLGTAACSSTPSTTTTAGSPTTTAAVTTTTAAATTTTAASTSGTKPSPTKTPITKPDKVEKVDSSKLPTGAQATPKGFTLTSDESDCVTYVVYKAYTDDPTLATDDATASGVAGGAVVACVPQEKIAGSIVDDIKNGSANLTDDQLACIKAQIVAADSQSLAIFVAALAYGQAAMLAPFKDALSKACNIPA